MKFSLLIALFLSISSLYGVEDTGNIVAYSPASQSSTNQTTRRTIINTPPPQTMTLMPIIQNPDCASPQYITSDFCRTSLVNTQPIQTIAVVPNVQNFDCNSPRYITTEACRRTVIHTPPPVTVVPVVPIIQNQTCTNQSFLARNSCVRINVVGQGVAPTNTISPAQAFALAKRAAIGDSYRLIAEKLKGVNVDGHDYIKNMVVRSSTVRTAVNAMIRNANITETTFKDGLCEVEMEISVYHSQFY